MPLNATECGPVYCNTGFTCSAGRCVDEQALARERAEIERSHQERLSHNDQPASTDNQQDALPANTLLVALIAGVLILLSFLFPSFIRNFSAPASPTPSPTTPPQSARGPQLQPGEILVREKATGRIGAIPETEFDSELYERA